MTTTFCGACGTPLPAAARFCGGCGTPVVTAGAGAGAGAAVSHGSSVLPPAGARDNGSGGSPGPAPQPAFAPPPAAQPAFGGAPTHPGAAPGPYAGAGPYEPGVPWARDRQAGPGRDDVDALLGGDWAGAALTAGAAVGAMVVVALAALLLVETYDEGGHALVSVTAMLVCAGFGGDLFARTESAAAGASVGALPLTLTLVGCTTLAVMFLRRTRQAGARDCLLQIVRTSLVLAVIVFLVSLVSRFHSDGTSSGVLDLTSGTVGASVASSLVGAVLFVVAALGAALFLARPRVLLPRLRAVQTTTRAGLAGSASVLVVGLLAAVGGLVYTLSTQEDKLAQLAVALLALPNLALATVLITLGVPLSVHGDVQGIGSTSGSSDRSVTLLTFTEDSAWWWAAPVVLALTVMVVAVTLVVRQHTLRDARREALRFAGCFALVAFLASLLLRVAGNGGGGLLDHDVSGRASVEFNPLVAAIVAGLWGLAAAVLAPQLATVVGHGFVSFVRRRFGTAPRSPAPQGGQPHGPGPAGPHGAPEPYRQPYEPPRQQPQPQPQQGSYEQPHQQPSAADQQRYAPPREPGGPDTDRQHP